MTTKRIGFCCKFIDRYGNNIKGYNLTSTTRKWANSVEEKELYNKLDSIVDTNISALRNVFSELSKKVNSLRMFRIGSEILPLYTTEEGQRVYYSNKTVQKKLESQLSILGNFARENNIRLSFHPGQFSVLGSHCDNIIANAIEDIEYHTYVAKLLGYGKNFQDFKINIHLSGKGGPSKFKESFYKLSKEAQNMLTVENEEFSWGLESTLELSSVLPIVLDIHHHWVKTEEYIKPNDKRVQQVIESWRGVRPVIHYSISKEHIINGDPNKLPQHDEIKKSQLRMHSDHYWNNKCNDWAASFWDNFDIQCECKTKNLGAETLFNHININI